MCDMYVPVLCVLSICPHLIIYVLTFYLLLLSLLLCPPPRGRKSTVCFLPICMLITYQVANLDKIFKTSKSLCVKVAILLHFA